MNKIANTFKELLLLSSGKAFFIPRVNVDPVLLIITEVSLNGSEQIVLNGHGYDSGIEYEWTCYDTSQGMNILNFVLLNYKEQEQ